MTRERELWVDVKLMNRIGWYFQGMTAGDFMWQTDKRLRTLDPDTHRLVYFIAEMDDDGDIYVHGDDDEWIRHYDLIAE